jgi:heme-degrading monooxygenase HmoA
MKSKTVVEFVSFQVRAGVTDEAFLKANADAQAFLGRMVGFQRRELFRDGDGWVDIVHWDSREAALAAAEKFPTATEFQVLMSMFDPESVKMRHLNVAMSA